jgi:hypothetical protein
MGREQGEPAGTLPGQPVPIPIKPRHVTIILGVLFISAGAWLAF